jgi:hypothetical protein
MNSHAMKPQGTQREHFKKFNYSLFIHNDINRMLFPQAKRVGNPSDLFGIVKKDFGQAGMTSETRLISSCIKWFLCP